MSDPALTTRQVANWIGVTQAYVRGEIKDGRLHAENIGRRGSREYRIRFSALATWAEAQGYRRLPQLTDFHAN